MSGRIVIVGGGVLGTMVAWSAHRRGLEVVHLERDLEPRGATVRNFGLIWVSGRAVGEELSLALEARSRWGDLTREAPGMGFRACGSLTVLHDEAEMAVIHQVLAREDADQRGFRLLDPDEARRCNPVLRGEFLAALHCRLDAVVESAATLGALRTALTGDRYHWLPGQVAVTIDDGRVVDHTGAMHKGDHVIVCPGASPEGPVAALLNEAPLQRVRLQMMQTRPLSSPCPTALADGSSLRYYPAFDVPARADLPRLDDVATRHHLQLLIAQRANAALTIGDTHDYDQPFDFAADEAAYAWLSDRVARLFGEPAPPIARRWAGIYEQCVDRGALYFSRRLSSGLTIVTGAGGRGMTLGPAIGERVMADIAP